MMMMGCCYDEEILFYYYVVSGALYYILLECNNQHVDLSVVVRNYTSTNNKKMCAIFCNQEEKLIGLIVRCCRVVVVV